MKADENEFTMKVVHHDKDYHFVCENQSPLGEIHDVLCIMKAHIIKMMQELDNPPQVVEEIVPEKCELEASCP